jgi:Ubiquitin family
MVPPKPVGSPHAIEIRVPRNYGPVIFHVDVKPNDKMDDLKTNISQIASYPVKDLFLLDNINIVGRFDNPQNFAFLDVAPLIDVEMPDKTTINVAAVPTMTIDDIKAAIEDKTGAPKANQRLFFLDNENDELHNMGPASKAGIKPGAALEVRPAEDCNVELQLPDGRSFSLDINHRWVW